MARRKSKGKRSRSRARGRGARSATKKTTHIQRSKRTTIVIETQGRGPKRTTVYEDVYEEEEW